MSKVVGVIATLLFACALGSAHAADKPATKGKSMERKATPPARAGWDLKKGGNATARKAPPATDTTARPRQGVEAQGRSAQGVAE